MNYNYVIYLYGNVNSIFVFQDRGFAFLSEIQICFDKSLKLTDCYNGPRNDDNITNCPLEKDIVFPTIVKVLRYQRLKNKAIQSCKN